MEPISNSKAEGLDTVPEDGGPLVTVGANIPHHPPEARPSRITRGSLANSTPAFQRRMTIVQQRRPTSVFGTPSNARETDDFVPDLPIRLAPITRDDIDLAFETLSRDGKRIKREDIKVFVDLLFSASTGGGGSANVPSSANPGLARTYSQAGGIGSTIGGGGGIVGGTSGGINANKAKALKLVTNGKEEVTKEGLINLLLNRALISMPFDEAFQWFDPHTDTGSSPALTEADLRRLAAAMSPYGVAHRGDVKALLAHFDRDGDGVLGLEDFKRMIL
ncbi:uncharacterized protein SPPG_01265 [Spizellomyces punctatus DAOM BR117]|uniref:EF-hand domain-containing protein n=1 Tax=Spizellomyces punctatus (strain DAOM BR117) TaxID=645134 RepID=A0A0L0HSG9_SPIPD|nr:uncharacterized protein SPPG_01265 [Spizellomyces punctatus DAOM BR117]KND03809.1 hypothetical protein SPPG_01265 [Spizellomyces punctatus DAOM BR117]|eukprot:XP_016611848.1 hypothetical protein SPPG_01265 [Spizellomyces punctatus DAOM BR117]